MRLGEARFTLPRGFPWKSKQHRLLVAKYFLSRGKLKECPLHTKWFSIAEEYLGMTNAELVKNVKNNHTAGGQYYTFRSTKYERLILVYIRFVSRCIVDLHNHIQYIGTANDSKTYNYDQSYINHLNILSAEELRVYMDLYIKPEIIPEIYKAYCSKIYSDVKLSRNTLRDEAIIITIILAKQAYDNDDMKFFKFLTNDLSRADINRYLKIYTPLEELYDENIEKDIAWGGSDLNIVRGLCQSVAGYDPFFTIDLMVNSAC